MVSAYPTQAKVLIMAGGTGGHVFPALTIARELLDRGAVVEWLGTRQGLEAKVISATSIPLHFISIGGLRGKGLARLLLAPFSIVRAILQALRTIRRIEPGCVLGMGGFVTGPGGIAARLLGRKLLIHEQNAIAGLTNQLLFPFASVVMEAFPDSFRRKQALGRGRIMSRFIRPDKIAVVGNPVRREILQLPAAEQRYAGRGGPLRLLVIGGSLGAVAINRLMPALLQRMGEPLHLRHQCGSRHLDETLGYYRDLGFAQDEHLQVLPFIDDMAAAYGWADVILCRAGASTVSEVAVAGLPAILVPYPWAVDDHQAANAGVLADAGAGWIIRQDELDTEKLIRILRPLAGDRSLLLRHARAAQAVAIRDASDRAATYCMEACHG